MLKQRGIPSRLTGTDFQFTIRRANVKEGATKIIRRERFKDRKSVDKKADSAFLLARPLRPDTLRCLGLFTSVAGRWGNRGQADYAVANETVNRLAWLLRARAAAAARASPGRR